MIIDIDELQAHGMLFCNLSLAHILTIGLGINASDITKLRNNNICTIAVSHSNLLRGIAADRHM